MYHPGLPDSGTGSPRAIGPLRSTASRFKGAERKEALVSVQPSSGAESSAGETLRGLVMLVCLVALPLAALRGAKWSDVASTLPAMAKRLLNCRWESNSAMAKENVAPDRPSVCGDSAIACTIPPPAAEEPAPDRGTTLGSDPFTSAAPENGSPEANLQPPGPAGLPDEAVARPEGSLCPPRAASPERPGSEDARWPSLQKMEMASVSRASLVPVSRRDRDGPAARPLRPFPTRISEVDGSDPSGPPSAATDRFTYALGRLKELGAVYYLLETWGSEGQRFRFHCKMAIGGNPGYTQHFEATDAEPMQAIARVLSEVEAWRAAP
jgi:hypothetical protein